MIDIIGASLEQLQEAVLTFLVPGFLVAFFVQLVIKPLIEGAERLALRIMKAEAGDYWTGQFKPLLINLLTFASAYVLMVFLGMQGKEAVLPAIFTMLAAIGEYEGAKNGLAALGWKWH